MPRAACIRILTVSLMLIAALACGRAVARGDTKPVHGYLGPRGDANAPESNPPTAWDATTGKNIAWKTLLPHWGHGAPLIVDGRAFVMSELGWDSDFPILTCIDTRDGRVLWQREINTLPVMMPPGLRRDSIADAWRKFHELDRQFFRARHIYDSAEDKDAALEKVGAMGFERSRKGRGGLAFKDARQPFQIARAFNKADLYFEVWHWGRPHCVGYAYPTPVSDGQFVYVATGLHGFACYDLDGNLRWLKFIPGQGSSNAGYGGNDFCKNARSPLLYGDLLISDVGNRVRGIDKQSGALRWSHENYVGHAPIVSPVVITTGGKDLLLSCGPRAYSLPDGGEIPVEGWKNRGATMLVNADQRDVVFFTGGGEHGGWEGKGNTEHPPPAAVRFSLDDGTLKATVLWSGINGKPIRQHAGMVYRDGKLHHSTGCILDARTGAILKGETRRRHGQNRATPRTRHMLWATRDHVYGITEARPRDGRPYGECDVYTLDGKHVATNKLLPAPVTDDRRDQLIATTGHPGWGFSYGCPFTIDGDRIFMRCHDYLYCIRNKE